MNVGKLHSILMDHKTNLKGTLHFIYIFLNRLIFQLPKS